MTFFHAQVLYVIYYVNDDYPYLTDKIRMT